MLTGKADRWLVPRVVSDARWVHEANKEMELWILARMWKLLLWNMMKIIFHQENKRMIVLP